MMRAAAVKPRFKGGLKKHSAVRLPRPRPSAFPREGVSGLEKPILYMLFFLGGYIPSVFYGRVLQSDIGEQLASYYMNFSELTAWPMSFLSQLAASFLQVLFTFLCGFSVFGIGFLILFFITKGAFLGFCAVNILTLGGIKSLTAYWLCICLPNVFLLIVILWLAGYSAQLSRNLFQSIFCGGAPRGRLESCTRRLVVRMLVSIPILGLISALGSGIAFLAAAFFP